MDKYSCFEDIKTKLEAHSFVIANMKEINYGLQFEIIMEDKKGIFRIYEGQKGIRLDFSQIRDAQLKAEIGDIIDGGHILKDTASPKQESHIKSVKDPVCLIGIDESGKGDYFGPLVIAGVYTDERTSITLREIGVKDSKKIKDPKIRELAEQIRNICPYSIVLVENERYNELYSSIKNLNKLLAWGHARVIENILEKVDCDYALSDQFGKAELVQNALMTKGRKIQLMQRTKAEENIAVAAASILARDKFVTGLNKIESLYEFDFPKGSSSQVVDSGKSFIKKFGQEELKKVAKVHFKITNQLIGE